VLVSKQIQIARRIHILTTISFNNLINGTLIATSKSRVLSTINQSRGTRMKKVLVILTSTMLLASVAHAKAPAAPVFNAPVKVGEGKIRGTNNKVAVDGSTVYVAYEDFSSGANFPFHVGKSVNSGAFWGLSEIPDQTSVGHANRARVTVGIDPVYTGQKIVHTVWRNEAGDVMYSFFATRPTQTGWSAPVRINGSYVGGEEIDLVATSNGAIHVLLDNYYTTSVSPDSNFTEPAALPAAGTGSIVKDAQDNLYVALSDSSSIYQVKKAAGSSNWSAPVTVTPAGTAVSGNISLAVADESSYYIAYADYTTSGVKLAVTTNGGASWTVRPVLALPEGVGPDVAIAVTPSKVVTLVTGTSNYPVSIKVVRSNDNGVLWSSPVTIQGTSSTTVALDDNNKAMIIVRDGEVGGDWSGVRNNSNANLLFLKEQ
jgi:hypothetical protein